MTRLVFVHGWGLDPSCWDALAARLSVYPQTRVDLGFFGAPSEMPEAEGAILIGHSLGFLRGMRRTGWAAIVAINAFARFVATPEQIGCASAAALRDLRRRLASDAGEALAGFHRTIGATTPAAAPIEDRLRDGLDDLREDLAAALAANTAPALVLAARNDPLVPEAASADLAALAKAQLHWHASGGHVLPFGDPAWCADHIRAFLRQARAAA